MRALVGLLLSLRYEFVVIEAKKMRLINRKNRKKEILLTWTSRPATRAWSKPPPDAFNHLVFTVWFGGTVLGEQRWLEAVQNYVLRRRMIRWTRRISRWFCVREDETKRSSLVVTDDPSGGGPYLLVWYFLRTYSLMWTLQAVRTLFVCLCSW